jgi:serine/threonine-protein kinase Chk1
VAACKVVALTPETKPYDRKMIEKEMQVHSALKHPNVLEFINAIIVEANGRSRYHPGIYMLLELAAGGDLFDKIGIPLRIFYYLKLISEDSSRCWHRRRDCPLLLHTNLMRNGLTTPSAMIYTQLNWPHRQDYIHREGVCHRDLKPENIMLDAAGVLKISDFGLCSVYKLKESGKTRLLSERCGSLPYIAPEVSVS